MKIDVEELGATKRRIKVEIPSEDVDGAVERAYRDLNKNVKIDGFRPGKVPRAILEKRYAKSVEAEVVESLVPEYYFRALEKESLQPVDKPKIDESGLRITKGAPLSFTATVEVRPKFELSEYKGIEVKDEKPVVTDEEMDGALRELREMHSTLEPIKGDRPAKKDDFVVIDFEGFIDGVAFEGGKAENYPLKLGSDTLIRGFEDQLEGASKGDEREVKVKFPVDYRNTELANKDAVFKVKVKEIKQPVLPELDDEFAGSLGVSEGLDELKKRVTEDILASKKRQIAAGQHEEIIKELIKRNDFELPPSMVEKEHNAMIIRRHQEILKAGQTPQSVGFDLEEFKAKTRPMAEERVKTTIILATIAEKENIGVTESELERWVANMAAETGRDPREIKDYYMKKDGSLDSLKAVLGEVKVLDMLLKEAKKA